MAVSTAFLNSLQLALRSLQLCDLSPINHMSDEEGLDPNTFPIFGLFTFILFMTPVLKWIYVNVMRE